MNYQFTDGLILIKNKDEWQKWANDLPGRNYVDIPNEYPCLACYFSYDTHNGDVCFAQYIYPKDAQNLIIEYWEQKDELRQNSQ